MHHTRATVQPRNDHEARTDSPASRRAVRYSSSSAIDGRHGVIPHSTALHRGVALRRYAAACLGALACAAFADTAAADLVGDFADNLTLDTEWVTGANNATDVAFATDGRAVITRKTGQVVVRRTDGTVNVVNYPFGGTLDTSSEKGLLGVAADPDSENTFYFYVSNGSTDDRHRVYRAILTEDDDIDVDPAPVVGEAVGNGPGLEGPANHDGGGLFIHDGFLYVSVGDTGFNQEQPDNKYGSCLNKGNGKILRVGLDGSVPDDNPLVDVGNATGCDSPNGDWSDEAPDERVYAWGLRNPFRFWIDPDTDLLWIGDVGELTQEEISVGDIGFHFGYPFEEGSRVWGAVDGRSGCTALSPSLDCTPPVHSYAHGASAAVTGGLIPSGCGWEEALGGTLYFFGDSSQNWIRALEVNAGRDGLASANAIDVGTFAAARPVAFRMGPDEALYIVMHGAGAVYRVVPNQCANGTGNGGAGGMPGNGGTAGVPSMGGFGGSNTGGSNTGGSSGGGSNVGGDAGAGANAGTNGEAGSGDAGASAGGSAGTSSGSAGAENGGAGTSEGGASANGGAPEPNGSAGTSTAGDGGTGPAPTATPTTPPTVPPTAVPTTPPGMTMTPDPETGGNGGAPSGGPTTAPTGSSTSDAGAGGADAEDAGGGGADGCGCRVPRTSAPSSAALSLLLATYAALLGRRARRRNLERGRLPSARRDLR